MQFVTTSPRRGPSWSAAAGFALALGVVLPASAGTLDRIKETGHIKLGYIVDARPFTFRGPSGAPEGYSIALCEHVAEEVKTQLALTSLTVDWVPTTVDARLKEIQQGNIDLLCSPTSDTLARRQQVAFSLPVFPGGVRAVLRADAPTALRDALSGAPVAKPLWRGSPAARVLEQATFAVVAGTPAERLLAERLTMFQIPATTVTVPSYAAGLKELLDGEVDVFFGDRSVVLGLLQGSDRQKVTVLDRLLTYESYALALARNDDDFRLLVDRSLSELFGSDQFTKTYQQWLGVLDEKSRLFFAWQARPQ